MSSPYLAKHSIAVYLEDLVSLVALRSSDPTFNAIEFAAAYFAAGLHAELHRGIHVTDHWQWTGAPMLCFERPRLSLPRRTTASASCASSSAHIGT
jgi:hypothetical protein